MRLLLFFDLPRLTDKQIKDAAKFRRELIKEGFLMLQESVYCKLALNESSLCSIKNRVRQLQPQEGNIMLLSVTERQFENIEFLLQKNSNDVVDSTQRLIIL